MRVLLYGTLSCHLCEQAEVLLRAARVNVEYIDIAEDGTLFEQYGTRIPVVRRVDNGAELDWPFDASGLNELLARARW